MGTVGPTVIAVLGSIFGLAIVAVLVSKKAQTPAVIQGAGTALSSIINAAMQPITSGGNQFGSTGGN